MSLRLPAQTLKQDLGCAYSGHKPCHTSCPLPDCIEAFASGQVHSIGSAYRAGGLPGAQRQMQEIK